MIWRKKILVRVSFSFFHSVLPLWKLRNFTATVFSLKFCQISVLQKLYYKLVWRKKNLLGSEFRFATLHSVEITEIISHFFGRNLLKALFFCVKLKYMHHSGKLKNLLSRKEYVISNSCTKFYCLYFSGFVHLGAGLAVGLSGLAAGYAIGIVGDAGVRGTAQQPRLFVGMILILIFAEVLGLYGLIVAIYLFTNAQ